MPSKSWYAITNKTDNSADVEIYDEIGGWGISAKGFISQLKGLDGKKDQSAHQLARWQYL